MGPEPLIALIREAMLATIAIYALLIPKANVLIVDRMDASQNQVVQNVPLINAFVAHASSMIGDQIGAIMDDNIMPVDHPKFRNGGVALGAIYLIPRVRSQTYTAKVCNMCKTMAL